MGQEACICAGGRCGRVRKVKLIYTVEIDEDVFELNGVLKTLNDVLEEKTDSTIIKSRIESPDEVCENGDWEV